MAGLVVDGMKHHGTRVIHGSVPEKIDRSTDTGRLHVYWSNQSQSEQFDTVLMAVGKIPLQYSRTKNSLNLYITNYTLSRPVGRYKEEGGGGRRVSDNYPYVWVWGPPWTPEAKFF